MANILLTLFYCLNSLYSILTRVHAVCTRQYAIFCISILAIFAIVGPFHRVLHDERGLSTPFDNLVPHWRMNEGFLVIPLINLLGSLKSAIAWTTSRMTPKTIFRFVQRVCGRELSLQSNAWLPLSSSSLYTSGSSISLALSASAEGSLWFCFWCAGFNDTREHFIYYSMSATGLFTLAGFEALLRGHWFIIMIIIIIIVTYVD